jgi:hypothetical protein
MACFLIRSVNNSFDQNQSFIDNGSIIQKILF